MLFGLISVGWAAVFVIGQRDYKRMLAYSSIEHIGILALGVGIGTGAVYGAMLHAVNHSLTKGMLFFAAGNILAAYRTRDVYRVHGVISTLPVTGVLWFAGFLSIVGMPPFGIFMSKFILIRTMFEQHRAGLAILFLSMLAVIFVGMGRTFVSMAQGRDSEAIAAQSSGESLAATLPPVALGLLTLVTGIWMPPALSEFLHGVARSLGGW